MRALAIPDPPLRDGEIVLRPMTPPIREADVAVFAKSLRDPYVRRRWEPRLGPLSDIEARQALEEQATSWTFGTGAGFFVDEEEGSGDAQTVAFVGVSFDPDKTPEINGWPADETKVRGKLGARVLRLLRDWLDELDYDRAVVPVPCGQPTVLRWIRESADFPYAPDFSYVPPWAIEARTQQAENE
jgi:RimJ/RimL family protein N-acetyltransferase